MHAFIHCSAYDRNQESAPALFLLLHAIYNQRTTQRPKSTTQGIITFYLYLNPGLVLPKIHYKISYTNIAAATTTTTQQTKKTPIHSFLNKNN